MTDKSFLDFIIPSIFADLNPKQKFVLKVNGRIMHKHVYDSERNAQIVADMLKEITPAELAAMKLNTVFQQINDVQVVPYEEKQAA